MDKGRVKVTIETKEGGETERVRGGGGVCVCTKEKLEGTHIGEQRKCRVRNINEQVRKFSVRNYQFRRGSIF